MIANRLIKQPLVLFGLMLLLLQSCSVQLIGEYDPITDQAIVELQQKVSKYLVKLERTAGTEAGNYVYYTEQLDDIKVALSTLEIRASSMEKYEIVKEQVSELGKMVHNLEKLHKDGFQSPEQVLLLKQPFNSAFIALVKLQQALKRGEKVNNK